ncbi:MAG TPA: MFS transporter [Flavisolibacter sp.]|nr:MFS transporter [Flavisolibacter sp.]
MEPCRLYRGGIGTYMIAHRVVPAVHFFLISAFIVAGVVACFHYLVAEEKSAPVKTRLLVKPDRSLVQLGILAFCCMVCEGAMFDWSGIYFQKVVNAEQGWIGAGYTAFMCTMAAGRFVADRIANRWNFATTLMASGVLIATGLTIAVVFPYVFSAALGFLIVGLGVSSVIPLVYSEAGKSKTTSPGMALTAVSSIGFLGFLIGPPLIGVIAGLFDLRVSFILIAAIGLFIAVFARLVMRRQIS